MPCSAIILLLCLVWISGFSMVMGDESSTTDPGTLAFDASGCGSVKGCLMKPRNCTPHKDCSYAVSYVADHERVYFELLGQVDSERNSYVALGFSVDGLMGGDTVTDCSSFQGEPFSARLSYNPGKSNRKVPMDSEIEAQMVHTHWTTHADGTLYCRFSQLIRPPSGVQSQFVRPLNTPIFILMSSGITQNRELNIHTLNADSPRFPYSSPNPVSLIHYQTATGHGFCPKCSGQGLYDQSTTGTPGSEANSTTTTTGNWTATSTDYGTTSEDGPESHDHQHQITDHSTSTTRVLVQAHGVLMVLAWLAFAPFGILCGRFLRTELLHLFGLQIWFQTHRLANTVASVAVAVAFCCILSANDGAWTGPRWSQTTEQNLLATSLHSLFGFMAVLLTLGQPLNALFRCAPASSNRALFNLIHRTSGYSAWILAVLSASIVCFSPQFDPHLADSFLARDLMIATMALMFVTFTVLQWIACRHKRTAMGPKDDENNFSIGSGVLGNTGKEIRLIQRAILALFLIAASALALSISVLIILA